MKILTDMRFLSRIKRPIVTLGNFDGLHLGHLRIIRKVRERAMRLGCPSLVYTFDPHPMKVVAPEKSPQLLLRLQDKVRLIKEEGIDSLLLARFTKEFAALHPRRFVLDSLVSCSAREVWVGHDFSFGRKKSGTVHYLKALGEEFGFKVNVIPAYKKAGAIVSSSRIRALLRAGNVGGAARLLGRPYSIHGRVVKGRGDGRALGFPTANLAVTSELIPDGGVYAVMATFNAKAYPAVLNIGTAPTFTHAMAGKEGVEAHLLDFKGNMYGKNIEIKFFRRLRAEKRFKSASALAKRIEMDVERAARIFAKGRNSLR